MLLRIKRSLKTAEGKLIEVHILVDAGDWIKSRASIEEITKIIQKSTKLPFDSISFTPVNIPSKLLHAKIYAVVSKTKPKSENRKGFIAVTSGNLTQRGLGIDKNKKSNVEALEIIKKAASINEFVKIIEDIKKKYILKTDTQDKFLLMLRIFSLGCFYHQWDGNLGNNVRFKLTLTTKGKQARAVDDQLFPNYTRDSNTISRDPLNLSSVFEVVPKPFPPRFWATYSIDTLVGRWVPLKISKFVDNILEKETEPYIKEIKKISTPKNINKIVSELEDDFKEFKDNDYIKEKKDVIKSWKERMKSFRNNSDLIKSCIFKYEKVPDMLSLLNRGIVMSSYKSLKLRLSMKQTKGLKAVIIRAFDNGGIQIEDELDALTQKAANMLNTRED